MGCEESFITIKLIWHSFLVLSLDNCIHETPIETGLSAWQPPVIGRDACMDARWSA